MASGRDHSQQTVRVSRARGRLLAAIGIAWFFLSPLLGAAILPADTLRGWWKDVWQSDTEAAVETYVDEIQNAAIWAQRPKIYDSSVKYLEKNYADLDPREVHGFPGIDAQEPVMLGFLATESAGWTGKLVLVSANVKEPPRLLTPVTNDIGSYQVTLADRHVPRAEVVCRLPFERTLPFRKADRVTFTGLVLADGLAERERGAGFTRVVYMACASMVRSTNISLSPGKGSEHPRLEVNP